MRKRLLYTNLHYLMQEEGIKDSDLAKIVKKETRTIKNWRYGKNKPFKNDKLILALYFDMLGKEKWLFEFKTDKK